MRLYCTGRLQVGTDVSRREFLLKLITELKMSDEEPDFSEESDFDVVVVAALPRCCS